MSELHVKRIENRLAQCFDSIDSSDITETSPEKRRVAVLSRALAAFAAALITGRQLSDMCTYVTDGYQDNGIDLIYFSQQEKTLYLVQSKWSQKGNKTIDLGDCLKYIEGVKKVLLNETDSSNGKIKARQADIESAVLDADAKFVLLIAHTGSQKLSNEVLAALNSYIAAQNDTSEIMSLRVLNQQDLHNALASGLSGAPISVEVQLGGWAQIREPHYAIYGRVCAQDVAAWFEKFGTRLFQPNLRQFLGSSPVNQELVDTLLKRPEDFWFFNNGITAIADAIRKKPLGGSSTDSGIFECDGFYVVNGAQTVGAIHSANLTDADSVSRAMVPLRIVSIDDVAFGAEVTRCTNTQNSIEKRDFVALDELQEKLRQDLLFDGVDYAYKSGASSGSSENQFDLQEATIALACANDDVALSVIAKRGVSRLWEDIQKPPYNLLFNDRLKGPDLWNLVQVSRLIDGALKSASAIFWTHGRERLVCVHGNRWIQWLVFKRFKEEGNLTAEHVSLSVYHVTIAAAEDAIRLVFELYPDSYPANIFKNTGKCKEMASHIA